MAAVSIVTRFGTPSDITPPSGDSIMPTPADNLRESFVVNKGSHLSVEESKSNMSFGLGNVMPASKDSSWVVAE